MAHAHAQSLLGRDTCAIHCHATKKKLKKSVHLEMRNLKLTELQRQRKERLRIRPEKDRARRRTKGKKRSPDTDDYEKERLATLKRLKRGEVDLRLEKVVASKQLRLAVDTEEERRTRLEPFLKSWQLCLSFKLDVLPTTERNSDHDLLSASLILLDMYLITYTL